ncbi:hypothetical protein SAMN05660841_02849 [Sphingobacterium nematocida]|uniref:RNA polymerase sigma-70 factor, ECF subfamily n=1 Tax=Sphingobacterium nematocida TaxID=1513896 RepID=A0A1T5EXR0_9SPHI|nr:hypothetical protein [Sphingobacterium nematocida]SKB88490.1 hypothetical protein SAMN05660841_02849 [Sphingobacterium nematocida]
MNRDIQEQQLWGALCAGDQDALQKLYVSYYNGLLQYGLKYSDDRDTLKDSINSTFLYIWENRAGLSYANHVGSYIFMFSCTDQEPLVAELFNLAKIAFGTNFLMTQPKNTP